MRELEDKHEYGREDMALVILGTSSCGEEKRARTWMANQYPGIQISTKGDLEGKEAKVVITIGTSNLDTLTTLVSFICQSLF